MTASQAQQAPTTDGRPRLARRLRANFLGLVGALVGLGAALTPSLLPRPVVLEGVVAGLGVALGYGVGTSTSWLLRRFVGHEPGPDTKRWAWRLLVWVGLVLCVLFLVQGVRWQDEVRSLVGEPPQAWSAVPLVAAVAGLVAALCVVLARGLRRGTAWLWRRLGRILPRPLARSVALVLVTSLLVVAAAGVLDRAFVGLVNRVYASSNEGTPAGIQQPAAPQRSGSPTSLVSWQSLGAEGRRFVARGPTREQLEAFNGRPAGEPVRVYVGLESAPDAAARAALAVQELRRTGAFERAVLVVAGTTGTGWLEPQTIDSLEYEWNGDTAVVGIQYSYLPSWISTVVDVENASDAGRELFDAVHAAWAQLPLERRPALVAYGLSLGSFSMQAGFGSVGDLTNRTDGALFVGSPNFSEPWKTITRTRDPGSPEWQPVYRQGTTVRFIGVPADLAALPGPWDRPRVLYVQHASDPVVWWSPALIARRPDWLGEPPGPDRTSQMHWFPVVTFLQVTVDQFVGVSVPNGHGHNYATAIPAAWNAVVPAPRWTDADTERLTALVADYAIE